MLVDFGKANPLEKARQQPDKVRQVLEKVKTDILQGGREYGIATLQHENLASARFFAFRA